MSSDYYILRRDKVYNDEFNIIKFDTKEEYKKLKKEVSARRQYLNNVIYQRNLEENPLENKKYVLFPKNNHIKYIFWGSSGSGKTKNTMNMLKIYAALNGKTTIIFYFSPVDEDKYRDETLHKISEFTKGKVFFYNCQVIKEIPTLYKLQEIILNFKAELNENKKNKLIKKLGPEAFKEFKTSQFINPHSICIFDDCEGCTKRAVLYDNQPIPVSKGIYQIISFLSLAGRSHSANKPTIEYICIQHNLTIAGRISEFNTILFESNLIGFNYSSLTIRSIKYIDERWGVELPTRRSPDYPNDKFVFFTLSYPHLLIYDEKCLNLSN